MALNSMFTTSGDIKLMNLLTSHNERIKLLDHFCINSIGLMKNKLKHHFDGLVKNPNIWQTDSR
jgi:hypothetical protein